MARQLRAVIFDMDGLLVDSEPLWRRAEQAVFPRVGIHLTDEMCMQTMGTRVDEVVAHWHTMRPWDEPSQEQVAADIVAAVVDLVRREGEPMAGVEYILDFFRTRGWRVALASSSSHALIDAVVDTLAIRDRFEVLQSAEHEPYGKPHPGVFLSAAAALDADPTACLVFEDSFAGVIAGLAARMQVVAVPAPADFGDPRFGAAHLQLRSLLDFDEGCLRQLASPPD